MLRPVSLFGAGAVLVVLLAGYGVSIQPRISSSGPDEPSGFPGSGDPGPISGSPGLGAVPEDRTSVEQICRLDRVPFGWVVVAYAEGRESCPQALDEDNPYNVAFIEQYRYRAPGTILTICADQPVPRGWVREPPRDDDGECAGARVKEGMPTAVQIRRVR
jgi:hypothetical protein